LAASFPSDAATESPFAAKGNPKNEIASFRALKVQKPAIPKPTAARNSTPNQSLSV
jgi:hypothetical protein